MVVWVCACCVIAEDAGGCEVVLRNGSLMGFELQPIRALEEGKLQPTEVHARNKCNTIKNLIPRALLLCQPALCFRPFAVSSVIGYMCVRGSGNFSITIRTVFKWNDEDDEECETWRINAGGAIPVLSDVEGE